jgi:hypothetical protein
MSRPAAPGRNDPCPCGSGRKFKKCCLVALERDEAARVRLRAIEARLVPRLDTLAMTRWGQPYFDEAWEEFFDWDHVPQDVEGTPEFESMFLTWFVFSFIPDPDRPGAGSDLPNVPAALVYLEEHEDDLSLEEQQFIAAALDAPFSFFAVTKTSPGRDLHLRDIFTGAECRVLERSASAMVEAGVLLYGKIVTLDGASVLLAWSPHVIPPMWHTRIIDSRERTLRSRKASADRLHDFDHEIRQLYLAIADAIRNPAPPVLQNTDGERLRPTTMEFELRASPQLAFERLKPLTRSTDDEALLDAAEREPDGRLRAVTLVWLKRGNRQHREWENTVLGTVRIEPGRIVAEANSERRAQRLRAEIERRLGLAADFARSEAGSVEEFVERRAHALTVSSAAAVPDEPADPVLRAALADSVAQGWEAWLDERVPALANKTPRQAAKTALGRERLEALFADFAWRAERLPPHLRVDVEMLRRKLGV